MDAEADCLVTPCPLCHLNLDLQQPLAAGVVGRPLNMPVLHLPQLLGLALGPRAQGAGHEQARRQAVVGDRLVDVGRGRARGLEDRGLDGRRAVEVEVHLGLVVVGAAVDGLGQPVLGEELVVAVAAVEGVLLAPPLSESLPSPPTSTAWATVSLVASSRSENPLPLT